MRDSLKLRWVVVGGVLLCAGCESETPSDPVRVVEHETAGTIELEVTYGILQRAVPLRIYLPDEVSPRPLVLFSHGLGGSNQGSRYLGEHWAAHGYVAVFLQHVGSDESVWRNLPASERLTALNGASNLRNTLNRLRDVPAVIDQLAVWSARAGHPLEGRLDLGRIGMAGHSYGAVTTQAVSGQTQRGKARFTDERIKAALVLSPSAPGRGKPSEHFGEVRIPWMLMTGTRDIAVVGTQDLSARLAVFPALPDGDKFELVFEGGEHNAFTDGASPGRERNPNHHPVILALSTAFWDAYLREDETAEAWLKNGLVDERLEPGDRWQFK